MPTLVVPFRGTGGKSRLEPLPGHTRTALARAMFEDVVEACAAVGATFIVAPEALQTKYAAPEAPQTEGTTFVPDPHGGQGMAVQAGLSAASLATGSTGPYLVVNADLPCVTARDLLALAGAIPAGGLALAQATDGTTNALGLASPDLFAPVYGPGSAARFAALAPSRTVEAPNLIDDVDTVRDLRRLHARLGPRTRALLASLQLCAAA